MISHIYASAARGHENLAYIPKNWIQGQRFFFPHTVFGLLVGINKIIFDFCPYVFLRQTQKQRGFVRIHFQQQKIFREKKKKTKSRCVDVRKTTLMTHSFAYEYASSAYKGHGVPKRVPATYDA